MSNYTIDDVIAKMLRHADTHKTCASGAVCREFAEMLKEAWKRESEKPNSVIQAQRSQFDAEIDRSRREVVVAKMETTTKESLVVGNAAKLREAVEAIISGYKKADLCDMNYGEWCHDPANICANVSLCKAIHEARAALAAPPRNCDVGTAEEQIKRFERFCQENHEYWKPSKSLTAIQRCNCPCHKGNSCNYFIWAQMPYEEGGAK